MTKPPEPAGDTYAEMARELDSGLIDQMKNGVLILDREGFPIEDPNKPGVYLKKHPQPSVYATALRRLQQVGFVKPSGKTSELERLASEAAAARPGVPAPEPSDDEEAE